MSVSMFDATVEAAQPGRSRAELSTFERISFRLLDGSVRTIEKAVARPAIADQLRPGNKARFYLFEDPERRGVHGVRYPNGWVLYDYPDTYAKILPVIGAASLAWFLYNLIIEHNISLIGFAVLALTTGAYVLLKKRQREAEWQVGSDYGFVRTVPMLPSPDQTTTRSTWVPLVEPITAAAAEPAQEANAPSKSEPERKEPAFAEPELVEPEIVEEPQQEPGDVIELPGPAQTEPAREPVEERLAAAAK